MDKRKVKEITQIAIGIFIMSIGFYFFVLPANLVIGGVMGVAVIVQDYIKVSYLMYIANIVLLIIAYFTLGKTFFLKTIFATILSPTIIFIFENTIPQDFFFKLLNEVPLLVSALLGGVFIGTGVGMVFRSNATTGGIDIIQNILNKYLHIPFSTAIYITDGIIIGVALFINFQLGLYAIFAMMISANIIDKLAIEGKSAYTAFIISNKYENMQKDIYEKLERGVTLVDATGGFSKQNKKMLICTIDVKEIYLLKRIIKENDDKAFTFVSKTKEALGEGFSREVATWEIKN
jgi:uncharacterized membrane-anchored protein YitT (DUF2179 family)